MPGSSAAPAAAAPVDAAPPPSSKCPCVQHWSSRKSEQHWSACLQTRGLVHSHHMRIPPQHIQEGRSLRLTPPWPTVLHGRVWAAAGVGTAGCCTLDGWTEKTVLLLRQSSLVGGSEVDRQPQQQGQHQQPSTPTGQQSAVGGSSRAGQAWLQRPCSSRSPSAPNSREELVRVAHHLPIDAALSHQNGGPPLLL